jgi:hypothetical protein
MKKFFIFTIDKNKSKIDLLRSSIKISIIIFISLYFLGNFTPFYESNDGYTIASTAIQISQGNFVYSNQLLENRGNFEFVPGDWGLTIDNKHAIPFGDVGIFLIPSFSYILAGNFGLFYFGPIIGILFLITSERVATNFFGKNVGLLTLLLLATNHLISRSFVNLQSEGLFCMFFLIGCYFLKKFFDHTNNLNILLASTFFAIATLMRINGIVVFPIEVLLVLGYFIVKNFQKKKYKNINNKNYSLISNRNFFSIKNYSKIGILLIIPWIIFFTFWFGYHETFFGDPFTNYVIEQRGIENTDAKLISFGTFNYEKFEIISQYSKYILPYQFPAIENKIFKSSEPILNISFFGILTLLLLSIFFIFSLKNYKERKTIIIFISIILGTVWFFSALTTENRASFGVPGRYMFPAFTLFYMVLAFFIVKTFQFDNTKTFFTNLKNPLKISLMIFLILFFGIAFYFTPMVSSVTSNTFTFNDPFMLSKNHPPNNEGLKSDNVIMAIKTDRILEYDAIPFHVLPINDAFFPSESANLLSQIMQDGYQVYIFKEGTTLQEKTVFNSLIDTFNFKLEDYSDSFCKVNFIQTSNSTLEDKSTLQCFP